MRPETITRLPMAVRFFTGAALGFAVVGYSMESLRAGIAGALASGLIVGMIGGAMIGGTALGIGSILATGISKAAIYGAFLGAPLGAALASWVGLRIERWTRAASKESESVPEEGVWDREYDSEGKAPPTIATRDIRKTRGRRTWLLILFAILAIPPALLFLSLFGLFPWSRINCWESEIDLNGGRLRHTRYVLWLPVSRAVRDSPLTQALAPGDRSNLGEDWQPVVTLSPGWRHSPHYRYHGAIHQIRSLEISWEFGKMTPEARRETARVVLRLWQREGGYMPAEDYLEKVWERAREADQAGKFIDLKDLPEP